MAARLLQDYLEHVQTWLSMAAPRDETALVVLDVMQYRKRLDRIVKPPVVTPLGTTAP